MTIEALMKNVSKSEGREIVVLPDAEELSRRAAEMFVELADGAVSSFGRFAVALSGGATPKTLYALLAEPQFSAHVAWSSVHVFWGDERWVPPDHPDSNYAMTRASLLNKVPIPDANVHRIPAEKADPKVAAAEYEQTLREFFNLEAGEPPRFDLILLGMGSDGHTASLFPGTAALEETERLVAANHVEKIEAHRITLTVPVINQAANLVFLISGESKAPVLAQVLRGPFEPRRLPSQLVRPTKGRLLFLLDAAAAQAVDTLKEVP